MQLSAKDTLELLDAKQQVLGQIAVERTDHGLVIGEFMRHPAFSAVEQLFRDYEDAVNVQALSVVDALDAQIARLGLQVVVPDGRPLAVQDVQIWSDGAITFRPSPQGEAIGETLVADHPAKR